MPPLRQGVEASCGAAPTRLGMFLQGAVRAHRVACPAARADLIYQPLGILDEGFIPDGLRSEPHLIRAFRIRRASERPIGS
ncbi:hypothetical protein AB0M45_10545 [Nocardia sp. NPDC051787]|uniref:hypothetical protein n=1 Tax=Nocardia sp. NPDC051787 TaxID=3155415 RepID=UPI003419BDF5